MMNCAHSSMPNLPARWWGLDTCGMSVQIAQDLTVDHRLAAQSLRLPIGHSLPYGSPYLAVTDLMKRWPGDGNRREVIMFTDGIGRDGSHRGWHRFYHVEADSDTAIAVAQRTSTNILRLEYQRSHRV